MSNYAYTIGQTSSGRLFTVDDDRQMIYSDDEGQTWDLLPMIGFEGSVSTFHFLDDTNGLISAGNSLYKTNDAGNTVSKIAQVYGINNIYMFSLDHFIYTFATNNWTTIQETTDGGQSWTNTGFFCTTSFGSYFDGDETIWYAQKGGHINKHTILEASGLKTTHKNPKTLIISPNPVKVGESITITNDEISSLNIKIFDITGKLRYHITDFLPGEKILTIDFQAGAYIIESINSKNERSIGKLVLYE